MGGLSFAEFVDDVGTNSWNDDGDGVVGDSKVESPTLPNERKSLEGRAKSVASAPTQGDPTVELHDNTKNPQK